MLPLTQRQSCLSASSYTRFQRFRKGNSRPKNQGFLVWTTGTKLRDRFGLEGVALVGDRGMMTQTQIDYLKQHPVSGWISALRNSDILRLFEKGLVQTSLFDARNLAEITVDPCEPLVVCHNPVLADRRRRERDALLGATEEVFGKIQRYVARRTQTPLTVTVIAEKVGRG